MSVFVFAVQRRLGELRVWLEQGSEYRKAKKLCTHLGVREYLGRYDFIRSKGLPWVHE
jgi:hypothetical protein